jgi:hypothetical protein
MDSEELAEDLSLAMLMSNRARRAQLAVDRLGAGIPRMNTARMTKALEIIAVDGCDNFTAESGETCRGQNSGRRIIAEFSADQWCWQCIAAWGLGK